MSKDRFANWPATWRDDKIHYAGGCEICGACSEPGWVKVEAISIGFCRCCIAFLVTAAPQVARDALASLAINAQTASQGETTS